MSDGAFRMEHDLLGNFPVPVDASYGIQTARDLENLHVSGVPLDLFPR